MLQSDIDEIVNSLPESFWGQFSGKRILLTGGCGFLGRYFTAVFARVNETLFSFAGWKPCELIVLDNFIVPGDERAVVGRRGVHFVEHNIIQPFVPERPLDFILHAAGIASPEVYLKYPEQAFLVSIVGTINVLNLARKYPGCKLAFFSSSEIYGDPDPKRVPTTESYWGNVDPIGLRACYDEGKRGGETLVSVWHREYGVHATIIRPFNVYGPSQMRSDGRVLPKFAAALADGEPLPVYLPGTQTRTFCYVTDAIRGFLQVLVNGKPGQPYNIGNPQPEISMRDLAVTVAEITGCKLPFDVVGHPESYPADEPQRRCPDISKAREHVGYEPRVALRDGLSRFFGWAKEAYRVSVLDKDGNEEAA